MEQLAARRSRGVPETRGQRGRSPPPVSAGDARSVATRSKLLSHKSVAEPALRLSTKPSRALPETAVGRTIAGKYLDLLVASLVKRDGKQADPSLLGVAGRFADTASAGSMWVRLPTVSRHAVGRGFPKGRNAKPP